MPKSRDQLSQPPPPLDGGWGWIAVLAAFIAHVLTSGYMLSLSVFLVEWQIFFDSNAQMVSLVGVVLGFMGPVMGLPAGGLSKTFGCRTVVMISGFSLSLGMLLSKFATELHHLYLTTMLIAFLKDATGSYNISFFFAAGALFLGGSSMLMLHTLKQPQERRNDADRDEAVQERVSEEEKNSKEHLPLNEVLAVKGEMNRTVQESTDEPV